MKRIKFRIIENVNELRSLLPEIQKLADSDKEALGFLPAAALSDAIDRKRIMAIVNDKDGAPEFAGYLLYGGVYPYAKIQQISAVPKYRRCGAASALIKSFASELERLGFMRIKAEVASDLPNALAFYAKNKFEIVRNRAGGQARNRTIIVHERQLETDDLFSFQLNNEIALGLRRRSSGEPFFSFDLNVYLDLVREREQSDNARRLFAAALAHEIRLVVADEFVVELKRNSKDLSSDPLLHMAIQLPRLPKVDPAELEKLALKIHDLVFVQPQAKGANGKQAISDAHHLAHAALTRASAFVTRDGAMLSSRSQLLSKIGIDVIAIDELIALLPAETIAPSPVSGQGFVSQSISSSDLTTYLQRAAVPESLVSEFVSDVQANAVIHSAAIFENERPIAIGILKASKGIGATVRMLIHVSPEHVDAEMFADYLLDTLTRKACYKTSATIELATLTTQTSVNNLAKSKGFHRSSFANDYAKVGVGKPLTPTSWPLLAKEIQRTSSISLPEKFPPLTQKHQLSIQSSSKHPIELTIRHLEDLLSPTIIIWPGREGVIVPISRRYADDLLGTSIQNSLAFMPNHDAAFLSRRGYVNSPRTARLMRPDSPILFYESKTRGNGRGAVVAVARIVDSIVMHKSEVPTDGQRRLVVDSVDSFSATDDILVTTFDNLMVLPHPVPLNKLKKLDAVGKANLVSAVSLSSEKIEAILTEGWINAKVA
jgi:ribosomal protein S18 acetylase RimI-like enzyme/predicted nucleic acid-binding protein